MRVPAALLPALWKAARAYARLLPPEVKMPTPDRDVLERIVFRAVFCDAEVSSMLFVGCAGYTAWYPQLFRFRPGFRFATIDPDPSQASYGARGDHRVATLESLADVREEHGRFEIVCANGVFGYGIDTEAERRDALRAVHLLLRAGGRLLIGYSTAPERNEFDVSLLDKRDWVPAAVPGLGRHEFHSGSKLEHAFACYRRA